MKRLFLLLSATLLIFVFTSGIALADVIQVTLTYVGGQLVRTPPGPYLKSAGDTFEVTNNTDFSVWVQLWEGEVHMHGNMVVAPGDTDALPLQCIETLVCYDYPVGGGGTTEFVCDQMIPIGDDCENHKMHYPQLPDPNGWDVMATGNVGLPNATTLADDWECSESGYVQDIHFWGSWFADLEGEILQFHVAIHENIPQGPHGWSIPGEELWFREITMDQVGVSGPFTGNQGWYDPASGIVEPNNHQFYYRYDILLDQDDWFWQDAGTVYWLRISAFVMDEAYQWGWKSSVDHFMDDAVWSPYAYPFEWTEMYEPDGGGGDPVVNQFWVAFDPGGMIIPELSGGTDFFPAGINGWVWYYSDWWNIWFYNAPFDWDRYKEISTMGWVQKLEPTMPAWVEIAIDWSGPNWPPGQPPPIAPEEEEFIERLTIFASDLPAGEEPFDIWGHIIPDYNPEWVSIDVRGFNFVIWDANPGLIEHECIGAGQEQSLDLAFCITGEPGADIPSLNEWGMLILALLLLAAGTVAVVRRRKAAMSRAD